MSDEAALEHYDSMPETKRNGQRGHAVVAVHGQVFQVDDCVGSERIGPLEAEGDVELALHGRVRRRHLHRDERLIGLELLKAGNEEKKQ